MTKKYFRMHPASLLRIRQTLRNVLEELEKELADEPASAEKPPRRNTYRKEVEATKQKFIKPKP